MTRFVAENGYIYSFEYIREMSNEVLAQEIRESGEYEWPLIRELVWRASCNDEKIDDQADLFDDDDTEIEDLWDIALEAAEVLSVKI